jgi:hypothetical protein
MAHGGPRFAISALKRKRASLAAEIVQCERQLRHLKEALQHVDFTFKLLDPSADLTSIPIKRLPKRVNLFRMGELSGAVLDTLRRADRSLSTGEIVAAIIRAGGHGDAARSAVAPRVRSNLQYQVRRGKVLKSGTQRDAMWRLT